MLHRLARWFAIAIAVLLGVAARAVMDNRAIEHCEQLAEKRLLQALAWSHVLPYAELKTRAAINVDDTTFQRVLNELITRGLVQRKAARQSL
jgi:hypothetical protein